MKLELYNFMLEVTRKCNMNCDHCLRGNAENKDMSIETMRNALKDISLISSVTITGGEPSLAICQIRNFMDICTEFNIEVQNFYIATNAKANTKEFIKVCIDLYLFCTDNEISSVEISSDSFHEDIPEQNIRALKVLNFVGDRRELSEKYLIPEGRAALNFCCDREPETDDKLEIEIDETVLRVTEGNVYVNVKGDICLNCDYSYETQAERAIGNVNKESLLSVIQKYNNEKVKEI
jgi:organic radical activating enzyme